jgi:hypothetical protein
MRKDRKRTGEKEDGNDGRNRDATRVTDDVDILHVRVRQYGAEGAETPAKGRATGESGKRMFRRAY